VAIAWIAISAVVIPHLKKYAANRADKLADHVLAKTYKRLVPDEKLAKANQTFVVRFGKELDSAIDLATLNTAVYQQAVETFLSNPSVQDVLQAPLDGQSDLDWELLRGIWRELRLIPLPSDFEWLRISKTYRQSLQNQMIVDAELRPVVQALAAVRAAEAGERAASALDRMVGPVNSFDLSRYAAALKNTYTHLRLGTLDSDWPHYERRLRLEAVYVPQSAKQALPPRDITRDYLRSLTARQASGEFDTDRDQLQIRTEEYARLGARPILGIVEDPASHLLVILGDPGLGKSTLLKLLALRWADDPCRPLTLFIELRRLSRVSDESFLSYLEKGTGEICCLPKLEMDAYLKAHESLVLLDGLDEVPAPARDSAVSKIIRFVGDYPKARVIVTTRIHGYYPGSNHPDQFRDAGFQQFTLQDFEDSEIHGFVQLWHREVFPDLVERERYEKRLREAIADSPAIHELASNPLLLTMMAVLCRTQDLPRDRCRLYERCAELLLKNWDLEKFPELKERKGALDIKDKLGPEQKMRILERVATEMQEQREGLTGNLIGENKLKGIVETELAQLEVRQPWSVADDLIWMLRERNFMLAYLGDGQYAFIHRTFLEYFCARDVKYRLEKTSSFNVSDLLGVFRRRWRDDAWKEVLRLLCGLVGVEYAQDCISELLAEERGTDGHEAGLLAAQCLQEIRETGQVRTVRNQVRQVLLRLTSFDFPYYYEPWQQPESRSVSEVRGRAIHELARGWRDDPQTGSWLKKLLLQGIHQPMRWANWRPQSDEDGRLRAAAARELTRNWKSDSDTLSLLKASIEYGEGPEARAAAIEEVARGWVLDVDILPWLKRVAISNAYYRARETAVREVARGWVGSQDTVIWLKTCADANDATVRKAALVELVRGWKDGPDTFRLLQRHVIRDDVHFVRATALSELVRGWKAHPDTLSLLKARAVHDINEEVRLEAVQALARGWKDRPETLSWVKERAHQDGAGIVRAAAVREVARGWKGESETLAWLKECASQDAAEEVRVAAVESVARGWKNEPEILSWVKDRALHDASEEVRIVSVVELARGWKDRSDTVSWLKERAALDGASGVRVAAIEEIAYGWKNDPATLVSLKDCASNHTCAVARAAAVHQIARGWREDPETLHFLMTYTRDVNGAVRAAALCELVRASHGDSAFDELLEDRATRDNDPIVREAALNELLRRTNTSSELLPLLQDRIDHDESDAVRELALMELLRRSEDDPDIQTDIQALLTDLVVNDDSALVRQRAIEALSTQWFVPELIPLFKSLLHDADPEIRRDVISALSDECDEDGEVLSALKERALQDESEEVRQTALRAMEDRTDDDDVFGLLKNRAVMDESPSVREQALDALTNGWKGQAETLAILRDRATLDQSPVVRQAAVWKLTNLWRGDAGIERFLDELLTPQS